MLGKLLKYEWKATGHSLLPLYLVVLAVSAVNSLMIHLGSSGPSPQMVRLMDSGLGEVIQLIGFMLYFGVIMALTVLTVVVIGQRFYKGVVGDEGYLVLTAPVGLWEIPLAKCLIGLVFGIFSMITAAASIIILMSPTAFVQMIREVDWILFFERLNLYVPQWALYAAVARGVDSNDTLQLIRVIPFSELWAPVAGVFILAGIIIGVGGSLSAIRKFLQV